MDVDYAEKMRQRALAEEEWKQQMVLREEAEAETMRKAAHERRRKEEEADREHAVNKKEWDEYQGLLKAYE